MSSDSNVLECRTGAETEFHREDLNFITSMCEAANRGLDLRAICHFVCEGTRRLFQSNGATIYLLSREKECLIVQNLNLSGLMAERIEKLVGGRIAPLRIHMHADSPYWRALQATGPVVHRGPQSIQSLMAEYTDDKRLRRLLPRIHRLLNINSVVILPLIAGGEAIGLMEIARKEDFTESDMARLGSIAPALTNVIRSRRAEETLKKSEQKYRCLVENNPNGIAIVQDNKFRFINRRILQMVRLYEEGEIIGSSIADFIAPEYREMVLSRGEARDRGENVPNSYEYRGLRSDGTEFDAEVFVSLVEYMGEKARQVVIRDISEQKQAGEALKQSEEKLRLVFNSMEEGIMVTDLEGTVLQVNDAAVKVYGYDSKEEVIGMNCYEYVPYGDRSRIRDGLKTMRENGHYRKVEFELLKKDGALFPAEVSVNVLKDSSGAAAGYVVITVDITQRKNAQAREQRLQEEFSRAGRLAAIGQLASGVAHELNNPLTVVLGFSQRLMRKIEDEVILRDIEKVYNEARRAARVVQNLLTFARPRQPEREPADINEILRKTLELRAYELQTSNIEVIWELNPHLPEVMVDYQQIQEVFLNIVFNAEQAILQAGNSGWITIRTEAWEDAISVKISDSGPGIAAEDLNNIFNPFFSTKEKQGGNGLGLSICHGIITEHSGKIHAESRPGEGASFVVRLPLNGCRE